MAQWIIRKHLTAAICCPAQAGEGFFGVQCAVIVSDFFAGSNVADGDFEIEPGAEAACGTGMIYEAPMVPAEDTVTGAIQIRVLVHLETQGFRQRTQFPRRDNLVERVAYPGNSAFRNQPCCKYAKPDRGADESKLRIRMNQDNRILDASDCTRATGIRYTHMFAAAVIRPPLFLELFPAGLQPRFQNGHLRIDHLPLFCIRRQLFQKAEAPVTRRAAFFVFPLVLLGQVAPPPTFEVASVKQNNSPEPRSEFNVKPDGVRITNYRLQFLIPYAFNIPVYALVGAPAWLDSNKYDIIARAPAGSAGSGPPERRWD